MGVKHLTIVNFKIACGISKYNCYNVAPLAIGSCDLNQQEISLIFVNIESIASELLVSVCIQNPVKNTI